MPARGRLTLAEIKQQPDIWPDTVRRTRASGITGIANPVITGAGTSAYASMAIEPAWPVARAVPSTELFLDPKRFVPGGGAVVSIARSGDSPESTAVVAKIPWARHIAITCNAEGLLKRTPDVEAILLDPRTNDRSVCMTSSFSNMVLAGIALARPSETEAALPAMCAGWEQRFEEFRAKARAIAATRPERVVILGSYPLFGAAREASLKLLEMTAGAIVPLAETYLAFRHGPMSFARPETLVLCLVSSDPARRRYEMDLVRELRAKGLGRLVAIGWVPEEEADSFDDVVLTSASTLPDELRTPTAIVFPQLLAFECSMALGLDPDNPSPSGVINRVVQGVRIYA